MAVFIQAGHDNQTAWYRVHNWYPISTPDSLLISGTTEMCFNQHEMHTILLQLSLHLYYRNVSYQPLISRSVIQAVLGSSMQLDW